MPFRESKGRAYVERRGCREDTVGGGHRQSRLLRSMFSQRANGHGMA